MSPHSFSRSLLKARLLLLALVLVVAGSIQAGADLGPVAPPMAAKVWRTADGLPQDSVTCMARTPDGFLWLGTEEGLARFDGVRVRTFTRANTPEMTNHNVQVLLVTRSGALLAGTYGGGLLRVEQGRLSVCSGGGALVGSRIQALAEAPDGGLWVATTRSLLRLEGCDVARVVAPRMLDQADVRALAVDVSGALWIGTWGRGVLRLAPEGPPEALTAAEGLPSNTVVSLAEEPGRGMWIGTSNGVAVVSRDGSISAPFHDLLGRELVWGMSPDGREGMWLATGGGLWHLAAGHAARPLAPASGRPVVARCLTEADGALWVGTVGSGLIRFGVGAFFVADLAGGRRVATLARERAGGAWLGTGDGEVFRTNGKYSTPLGLQSVLRGSEVRALWQGRDGTLWIGTWLGVYRWRNGEVTEIGRELGLEGRVVRSVFEDQRGALWVGTDGGGLTCTRGGTTKRVAVGNGPAGNQVREIVEDREGTVWVATYGGLSAVRGDAVSNLTTGDGLPSNLVRTLFEDVDGTLWIGTYGGGLARLREGRLAVFTSREGLASDIVYSIVDDDRGGLWLGSSCGVFRVEKDELEELASGRRKKVHSVVFSEVDGLPGGESYGNSRSALRTSDGRLWFATVSGLAVADPSAGSRPRPAPNVVIDDVVVDGVHLRWDDVTAVPAGSRRLEIDFAGVRLAAPGPLTYRFRLVGWDRDWIDAGDRRSAIYTHLPPGGYRFEVSATGLEGRSSDPVAIRLEMPPLWWQTSWLLLLAAGAVVLGGFGLHRGRVRRLEARERELASRVDEELKRVRVLQGLIPICASCKKIRDDAGYWTQLEAYIRDHSEAEFTHGFCPECLERLYGEWLPHRFPPKQEKRTGEAE